MSAVFVQLAEGFEEIEAVTIVDVLRRAGIETVMVAVGEDLTVTGGHGLAVKADRLFRETNFNTGSMIVLPGGAVGCENLAAHSGLAQVIMEYCQSGKFIAAICAAPGVLGSMGLLEGKKATCYPGLEDRLRNAVVTNSSVIRDGKIVTATGPATAIPFALKLVEILTGEAAARELADELLYNTGD